MEDPKILARKIVKYEEIIKKSADYQKKLEDDLIYTTKQLKNKIEVEELLKIELSK